MNVRIATSEDLPAILHLFKVSLGEEGGIPEPSFWNWKHEQNPFGQSPTILAFDGDKLIGLRTFMRWRFKKGTLVIPAYRAVDTATHPDYRGKGIFSKLTLQLLEQIKQGEPAIMYNTPNAQSKPGYLKMGWQELGKTPLYVKPLPFNIMRNFLAKREVSALTGWTMHVEQAWNELASDFASLTKSLITTDYSLEYLNWRYRNIPGFQYGTHVVEKGNDVALAFFRIKQSGRLKELRIGDLFYRTRNSSATKQLLREISKKHKPDVVTILCDQQGLVKGNLPFDFIHAKRAGLMITYREINDAGLVGLVSNPNHWMFSAGTIELF